MSLREKTAYLKGLYDGMGLNEDKSKEARMLGAIVDVLQEMSEHVEENEDSVAALADEMDELVETLHADDEDENHLMEDEYDHLHDEFGFEDEDDIEPLELPTVMACPSCGESLTVGADDLKDGVIVCPDCGGQFRIELELEEKEDEECLPF